MLGVGVYTYEWGEPGGAYIHMNWGAWWCHRFLELEPQAVVNPLM